MKILKIVRFRIREKHVMNSLIDDDLSQIMPPIQTSNTRNSEILPMNEEAAMKALIQPKWFIVLLSPFHLLWDDILGWYLRDYFFFDDYNSWFKNSRGWTWSGDLPYQRSWFVYVLTLWACQGPPQKKSCLKRSS